MAREERKERITRQREEQILDAALTVFTRKSYAGATIPDIASEAGIAVGTIYNYFENKRELFFAVIRYYIINTSLLDLISELPRGDIEVTFKQILQNRLNLIESADMSRIPFLMSEIMRDPELKALWAKELLEPFLTMMEGIYREINKSGIYRNIEPAITVRAVGGMILGFVMFSMMEGEDSPLHKMTRDKVMDTLVNFILYGLIGKVENTGSKES